MNHQYYVYILASKKNGTLYIGMTHDLVKRVWEHGQGFVAGFTKQHKINSLVYYEVTTDVNAAITRERQMKKWRRSWKIQLIESKNPTWDDLYEKLSSSGSPLSRG